ncbi:MAG: GGDEF domain-containing protein [Fibrobacterota bacterium]
MDILDEAQRFSTLLKQIDFGIIVEDEQRVIHLVNQRFLDLFQLPLSADEFMEMDCNAAAQGAKGYFLHEKSFIPRLEEILTRRETITDEVLQLKDGRYFERHYYPIFLDHIYKGHCWLYRDVTENEKMRKQLEELATIDPLTQAVNRRAFLPELAQALNLWKRYSNPYAILMFDIDGFKEINDTYGHKAGDTVLSTVANTVITTKRTTDIFCRWGGDEFIVLLPHTDLDNSLIFAERVRNLVENTPWGFTEDRITCSFGVAVFEPYTNQSKILETVDRALYNAKKKGRNCVGTV